MADSGKLVFKYVTEAKDMSWDIPDPDRVLTEIGNTVSAACWSSKVIRELEIENIRIELVIKDAKAESKSLKPVRKCKYDAAIGFV